LLPYPRNTLVELRAYGNTTAHASNAAIHMADHHIDPEFLAKLSLLFLLVLFFFHHAVQDASQRFDVIPRLSVF
jgi:hypothetical protein